MFEYFNNFYKWIEENPEKVDCTSVAVYFALLSTSNRLQWKDKFTIVLSDIQEMCGIGSRTTILKAITKLEENGFIKTISHSTNQYKNRIICLPLNERHVKSTRKATEKHLESNWTHHKTIKTSKDNKDLIDLKEKKINKKKPTLIPFIESIYNENFEQFDIDFSKTKTAIENPGIDKKKLFDSLQFSDEAKYRYVDWVKVAQVWYSRNPKQYNFSLTSMLEKDPAYAIMTKGQQVIHENRLKMELQRQFIKPNQDDELTF
jgi:DNA-binding Lrp family transcriptional regulator